jgi:hypothetical protein
MNAERLTYLLDRYVDEGLTPEEKQELEELLLSSPAARAQFWEHTQFHAAVRRWGEEAWGRRMAEAAETESSAAPAPTGRLRTWWENIRTAPRFAWLRWGLPLGAGATALTLLLVWKGAPAGTNASNALPVAVNAARPDDSTSLTDSPALIYANEPMDDGVAVLSRAVGVVWDPPGAAKPPGAVLRPGLLRLKAGLAQLDFYDGASVIVEGPAELDLISDKRVFVHYGRCSANVPELAHGFQVESPAIALVDLGTRFGVTVSTNGPSELHVFQGKVAVRRLGGAEVNSHLTQGNGVRVDADGRVEKIASAESEFTTTTTMFNAVQAAARKRLQQWRTDSQAWSADPDTLVHFLGDASIPEMATGVLRNHALANLAAGDGTVVGCAWTEGRWPGSRSLEFRNSGDRVRLNINGEYDQLTFLAWVRIDSLPNRFNSLMLSDDGYKRGAIQWQITHEGRLKLTFHYADGVLDQPDQQFFESMSTAPLLTHEYWGQWVHLASVYDRTTATVTHYVNGEMQPVEQHVYQKNVRTEARLISPVALHPGKVELGNWGLRFEMTSKTPKGVVSFVSPIRYFNGQIDECLLLRRALTPAEIRKHYENGRSINEDVLAVK